MKKMESLPDVAQFARNFSVMVRSQGPDPKGLKMRNHAFHLHQNGSTTLSASGILLPDGCLSDRSPMFDHVCSIHGHSGDLVVTTASVVEPFLTAEYRNKATHEFSPKLIPAACIDVLVEGKEEGIRSDESYVNPCWLNCKLLALVDVTASSVALSSLIGGESILQGSSSWEVGWSLATRDDGTQAMMVKSASRIAILGVPRVELKNILHLNISPAQQKGDLLLLMGSPFGILSPLHFLNSISFGTVSNCRASGSGQNSLLLADFRGLPGMEGGPVFDEHTCLIGMLTRPLRQKASNSEIQIVITWNAIASAWGNELQKKSQNSQQELNGQCADKERRVLPNFTNFGLMRCLPKGPDFVPLQKAMSSIALITVGDGTWASGIILDQQGLILTNAHVLEPWRFIRKSTVGLMSKRIESPVQYNISFSEKMRNPSKEESNRLFPSVLGNSNSYGVSAYDASLQNLSQKNYRKISVRLDNMENQLWYDASVVYVSKGPMDVALLQLDDVPSQFCAVSPEFDCPSIGLPVHVIGHGLLGPQSDIGPSVSSGIVSHVVRLPGPLHVEESGIVESEKRSVPVMLQTTAAVHPGASGGAVINSEGRMVGLITSNAKHGGGSTIPYLNFSIPCAALAPIFRFLDEHKLLSLKVLDEPNDLLSSVWSLVPSNSESEQSALEKNVGEGKGSRFSKFLAEKHSGFDPLKDVAQSIRNNLPSKM
ncbi:glyoxysomal processing protease, glyoxysomal [Canna indica]|uniref:Glyoxysomal processing protease, glyoxysomal n=1 Tax=Canna indica TaxID=4628 RepID=A0AAQ3KKP0_9LILI|nr:glyoxysomal processing protease, glyoxysomal [Canna indica]